MGVHILESSAYNLYKFRWNYFQFWRKL